MHDGLVRVFGDSVLEGLPRQMHAASTDLVTRRYHVHRRGTVVDAVNASARLPVLLAPIPDNGRVWPPLCSISTAVTVRSSMWCAPGARVWNVHPPRKPSGVIGNDGGDND